MDNLLFGQTDSKTLPSLQLVHLIQKGIHRTDLRSIAASTTSTRLRLECSRLKNTNLQSSVASPVACSGPAFQQVSLLVELQSVWPRSHLSLELSWVCWSW